jgi:hypothetical protein
MTSINWRAGALAALAGLALSACGGGDETGSSASNGVDGTPATAPANSAPHISGAPVTIVEASTLYAFQPTATDADGDSLTFSATGLPGWATFDAQTGEVSGTPTDADTGTTGDITIQVSDQKASSRLSPFKINVKGKGKGGGSGQSTNSAPTISGAPAPSVQAATAYNFTPTSSDPDGQTLSFSILNKPSWAGFNVSTGTLSGTPSSANVGVYTNVVIAVSDGALSTALPAFSITVTAAPNSPPSISGTPATNVVAGNAYSFTPTAFDANGDMLAFSISGKPAWATFNTATGKLSGTPASGQTGSYLNIVISVSDGTASAALGAFSITVSTAPNSGTATLSWSSPTQNTDGSQLTDLAGFRVYHGTSPDTLDEMTQLPGASTNGYQFNQLATGAHYFAVSAYTTSGVESALSTVGSKMIQ